MIKFENGMLVLDSTATKEDVDAINEFAAHHRDAAISLVKQRLLNAWSAYGQPEGSEYLWSMNEISDIITGRLDGKHPVFYDSEYKGKVPEGAIFLETN